MIATETDFTNFEPPQSLPGTESHCKRVAAWCEELARALHLPAHERSALIEAALSHHQPELLFGEGFSRLLEDMGFTVDQKLDAAAVSRLSNSILRVLHKGAGVHDRRSVELARMLEFVDSLDGEIEFAPYESENIRRILDQALNRQPVRDSNQQSPAKSLRQATRHDLLHVIPRLPVYPAAAMRLYRRLNEDDVSIPALEQIAKSDQVIAGKLIQAANSVYYSPMHQIRTVGQAISYIGTDDAGKVLLAASIQPLFSSPRVRKLWHHALEAAQVAEMLARLSGTIDTGEAFLLGLLHDIGKLALLLMPKGINDTLERLASRGCQISAAELVLCGFDHADAGAEVLRHWKFAEELIEAVEHHHEPERSEGQLASLLYLAEFWTDSEEDLPSNARLNYALKKCNLTAESIEAMRMDLNTAISSL